MRRGESRWVWWEEVWEIELWLEYKMKLKIKIKVKIFEGREGDKSMLGFCLSSKVAL